MIFLLNFLPKIPSPTVPRSGLLWSSPPLSSLWSWSSLFSIPSLSSQWHVSSISGREQTLGLGGRQRVAAVTVSANVRQNTLSKYQGDRPAAQSRAEECWLEENRGWAPSRGHVPLLPWDPEVGAHVGDLGAEAPAHGDGGRELGAQAEAGGGRSARGHGLQTRVREPGPQTLRQADLHWQGVHACPGRDQLLREEWRVQEPDICARGRDSLPVTRPAGWGGSAGAWGAHCEEVAGSEEALEQDEAESLHSHSPGGPGRGGQDTVQCGKHFMWESRQIVVLTMLMIKLTINSYYYKLEHFCSRSVFFPRVGVK